MNIAHETEPQMEYFPIPSPQCVFQSSFIYYIKTNSSLRMAFKLSKVNKKYFQRNFGVEDYPRLSEVEIYRETFRYFDRDRNRCNENESQLLSKKLWVTQKLAIYWSTPKAFHLIPESAAWDLKYLDISSHDLLFEEFKFLTKAGKIEYCELHKSLIFNKNKEEVSLENILECLPNVETITIDLLIPSIADLTVADALFPPKLTSVTLTYVKDTFNCDKFLRLMIAHQNVTYNLVLFNCCRVQPYRRKTEDSWGNKFPLPEISSSGKCRECQQKRA